MQAAYCQGSELEIYSRIRESLAGACELLGTKLGAGLNKSGLFWIFKAKPGKICQTVQVSLEMYSSAEPETHTLPQGN